MTETRIIELLQQIEGRNKENKLKFNDYSRLIPDHVAQISRFMADSIYETLKENSNSSKSKRMNFIQLLRRWCPIDENHFTINEYNFEFLLCSYRMEVQNLGVDSILNELCSEVNNLPPENVFNSLKEFYDENDLKANQKLRHLEYINQLDQDRLGKNDFFKIKSIIEAENIDSFLSNFVSDKFTINSYEVPKVKSSQKLLNISRENRIKLAYSLLNLKQNQNLHLLIKNILEEIALESDIAPNEMELVMYLWNDGEKEHQLLTLKLFSLIYEKPLISICQQLIDCTNDDETLKFVDTFRQDQRKLIENIKLLDDVKFKVFNLLNELFILSDYNENILNIAKLFKIT